MMTLTVESARYSAKTTEELQTQLDEREAQLKAELKAIRKAKRHLAAIDLKVTGVVAITAEAEESAERHSDEQDGTLELPDPTLPASVETTAEPEPEPLDSDDDQSIDAEEDQDQETDGEFTIDLPLELDTALHAYAKHVLEMHGGDKVKAALSLEISVQALDRRLQEPPRWKRSWAPYITAKTA